MRKNLWCALGWFLPNELYLILFNFEDFEKSIDFEDDEKVSTLKILNWKSINFEDVKKSSDFEHFPKVPILKMMKKYRMSWGSPARPAAELRGLFDKDRALYIALEQDLKVLTLYWSMTKMFTSCNLFDKDRALYIAQEQRALHCTRARFESSDSFTILKYDKNVYHLQALW